MSTLIDWTTTTPEQVVELVKHWRYFKADIETNITLLKKHRDYAKKHRNTEGLSYQEAYDLIIHLEDLFDRGLALERKTFPEDYTRKKLSMSNIEPSSVPMVETLS